MLLIRQVPSFYHNLLFHEEVTAQRWCYWEVDYMMACSTCYKEGFSVCEDLLAPLACALNTMK